MIAHTRRGLGHCVLPGSAEPPPRWCPDRASIGRRHQRAPPRHCVWWTTRGPAGAELQPRISGGCLDGFPGTDLPTASPGDGNQDGDRRSAVASLGWSSPCRRPLAVHPAAGHHGWSGPAGGGPGGGGCIARCGRADRIAARQTATRQTLEDEGCVWSGLLTKLPSPSSAIVPGESFGSGAVIRALQALRRGHSHLDPRLQEKLQQHRCRRTGREPQTLMGLARGWSNWKIAAGMASHRPRCATA